MTDEQDLTTADQEGVEDRPQSGRGIAWFAVVLSIVALGLSGYVGYIWYSFKDSGQEIAGMAGELSQLQRRVDENRQQMSREREAALESFANEHETELEQFQQTLDAALQKLNAESSTAPHDWLVAEVEYLIRMASQRVLMDKDPSGAIGLLVSADQILLQAENLTSHGLRAAIAQDIANLRAVDQLDIEGIYLRLAAQIRLVDELERPAYEFKPRSESQGAEAIQDKGLMGIATRFVKKFNSVLLRYVDFRRDTEQIVPILPPSEEYYLRQNLVLNLQQAQMGLLREKSDVFAVSLADALSWLNRFFDSEHAVTIAMRDTLVELQGVEVGRDLPDVSASLQEVRKLSRSANQVTLEQVTR